MQLFISRLSSLQLQRPLTRLISLQSYSYSTDSSDPNAKVKIEKIVKSNKIAVFMKGTPEQPKCGFSNAVAKILDMHGVSGYHSVNVLEDEEIRSGVKEYSDWPTIPQVYFNGEFVGGCDVMLEMHKNGSLIDELEKLGIKSKLVDSSLG